MRDYQATIDPEVLKAVTETADVAGIVPQVWSSEVEKAARPNRVMRGLIVLNTELKETGGDVVKIPKLGTLVAQKLTEATPTVPQKWDASTTVDITPEEGGAAVEVTWRALNRAYRNVMTDVTTELGEALAQMEDLEIIETMVAAPGTEIFSNGTGVDDITADDVFTVGLFKDALEALRTANVKKPHVCVIHPAVERSLLDDDQFVNASEYGDPSIVQTGEIGQYLGVRVFTSTNMPVADNTGGVPVYQSLFFGPRAAAMALKHDPDYREDEQILDRSSILASYIDYGVAVLNDYQIVLLYSAGGGAPSP